MTRVCLQAAELVNAEVTACKKMADRRGLLVVLLFCASARATEPAVNVDSVLEDSTSCHGVCDGTYPLHTYPEEEELFACQRGCRLFSICQFVDDGEDLNRTKVECESACLEAYPQPTEQYACNLGCHSQMPFAAKRQEELADLAPRIHILFPLAFVGAFWRDMLDSAQSFITGNPSWTFYVQADNGRIIVVQSESEIQLDPQFLSEKTQPAESFLDKISYLMPGPSTGQYGEERTWDQRSDSLNLDEGDNFLKCFSANSNWLISVTLVLSVLVLLWICCATVATAADQYIPSEKLSIYGDLEFMNEQKLHRYPPATLVVVHGRPEESEDAGPLPTKVDLTQSAI
ncbi:transmembrane protein 59 S homeolog isoform X1 [Xenopus laevis]|uniref:Transmembrane protein 59 n=1 Tax=Xenopus laevis TaxID=8355 RepID=A0A8J0V4Z6_XENLA|nr:transmembrane protein 59 S homeolog isoform X1 [Xenopus laevis]